MLKRAWVDVMEHVQLSDLILIQKNWIAVDKQGGSPDWYNLNWIDKHKTSRFQWCPCFLLYPSKVQEIEGDLITFFTFGHFLLRPRWKHDVTPFANKRWIYGKVFKYCRRQILTVGGLLKSNYNAHSATQCGVWSHTRRTLHTLHSAYSPPKHIATHRPMHTHSLCIHTCMPTM